MYDTSCVLIGEDLVDSEGLECYCHCVLQVCKTDIVSCGKYIFSIQITLP
jgi:hypothetical protein